MDHIGTDFFDAKIVGLYEVNQTLQGKFKIQEPINPCLYRDIFYIKKYDSNKKLSVAYIVSYGIQK